MNNKAPYNSSHRCEVFKDLVGELARPFSIIASSLAASIATVVIAEKVDGFEGAAIFIGAVWTGVVGLYTARAWENAKKDKHESEVEIAKANASTPTEPVA